MAIGADLLSTENLSENKKQILDKINRNIEMIREEASIYNIKRKDAQIKSFIKKMPTNFISILGERGSGKTSLALTIINKLSQSDQNIIFPIIDPSMFNVTDNALGWIIYSFEYKINEISKGIVQGYYCDNDNIKELKDKYNKLKEDYIESRKFYRDGIAGLAEGNYEYKKINEEIIFSDMKLSNHFYDFIDSFIISVRNGEFIKSSNKYDNRDNNDFEPLIFITFDDVDISPQMGPEILNVVLNYLKHPNIVVFILGKEDTFKEGLFLNSWNKENIPKCFKKNDVIVKSKLLEERVTRAEEFMQKVFPSLYSNSILGESLDYRLKFTPYGKLKSETNENVDKLYEVMDKINLEIIKGKNNKNEIIKEKTSIFKSLFFKARIEMDALANEYNNLFNAERSFEGAEEYYFEFQFKRKLYKKYIKKDENIGDNYNYHGDKIQYENVYDNANVYANLLFMYPRGLINFYYELKNYINDSNISLKIHRISGINSYGNTSRIKDIENNFKIIYWLYSYIRKNNLELNYNQDKYNIDNILKMDDINKKVYIDFTNITIKAKENYVDSCNLSQQLLTMIYLEVNMSDTQSAFIQFFYDISKQFLTEEYFIIVKDIDFSELIFYKNSRDKLQINMITLPYFYYYYLFQNIYEICLPIILQDRKVHRNIRDRLKAFTLYALYNLREYSLLGDILELSEWKTLNEWKLQKDEIFDYYQYQYNNFITKSKQNIKNEEMRKFTLLEFIVNSVEINDRLIFEFTEYIENDALASMYSKYVPYINSSYSIGSRISDINYLISYEDIRDIENFELMSKLKNATLKNLDDKDKWNSILKILALMDIELIKLILRNICNNKNIDNNIKAFEVQKLEKYINERVIPENVNEYKILITLLSQVRIAINTNNDNNIIKILQQLNISNEEKQRSSELEAEVKIVRPIQRLIANNEALNVYSRLIQLLGSKKNGASKIATIESIIKNSSNKLKSFTSILRLGDLTKQYYNEDDKSSFYSTKVNGQLFKMLQEYFVNVLKFIWDLDTEESVKIGYANNIINMIEKQLTKSNYSKYINTEENEEIIKGIKESTIKFEQMNLWLDEQKYILWRKEEIGETSNE